MCLADGQPIVRRFVIEAIFAIAGGALPVLIGQFETRFSDEEFFILFEIIELAIFWIILRQITRWWPFSPVRSQSGFTFRRHQPALILAILAVIGIFFVIHTYQHSLFTPYTPDYPGISKMAKNGHYIAAN